MKASKQKKLEAAGWKVGSASEFLELSDAEAMLVNMKLALAKKIKELRQSKKITQNDLAKLIGSSQSRVAKLETADRSVSMELLVRSLATLGASRDQIGKVVGTRGTAQKKPTRKKRLAKA
jgi:DNA-binding XRE family transcriptional regulator